MFMLYGPSAIAWWQTPPCIRDADLSKEGRTELLMSAPSRLRSALVRVRQNELTSMLSERLWMDLKGLPLPIHVAVDRLNGTRANELVAPHRLRAESLDRDLIDLGGGLNVPVPELALAQMARNTTPTQLLRLMYEFCGLYTEFSPTSRAQVVITQMRDAGLFDIQEDAHTSVVWEYLDEHGRVVPMPDVGRAASWRPCVTRSGVFTDMWRRPPLTNCEQIESAGAAWEQVRGSAAVSAACSEVIEGSGSFLETAAMMLICRSWRNGGEAWPRPQLNRRIYFDEGARTLAGAYSCIADQYWADQHVVIEVNGKGFHEDSNGYVQTTGRKAALEAMGFTVFDLEYGQIANLERLDYRLEVIGKRLGFPLQARTQRFLEKRETMHQELFPRTRRREYFF